MIFDKIDRRIKEMKELSRLEGIKASRAQQDSTDIKYRNLVNQIKEFIDVLTYVEENLKFILSDVLKSDLTNLLDSLKNAIRTGYSNRETIISAEGNFKLIQASIKKEWAMHFSLLMATTTNTLKVINGIDSEKVSDCLMYIKAAESWSTDMLVFTNLKMAIEKAETIIQSLNLDQETILFLTKMTSGKATIADLNESVLMWVRKESLESKIKLSFASR